MGRWHFYCALCGGTFTGCHISEQPHSARKKSGNDESEIEHGSNREQDYDSNAIEHSYDPDVITEQEAEWTLNLQCLGWNTNYWTSTSPQTFLSGIGTSDDYGYVDVPDGGDPNFPHDNSISAYYTFTDSETAYPFHPKCLDIFLMLVAHKSGTGATHLSVDGSWVPQSLEFDHDTMLTILHEQDGESLYRLEIHYGNPDPPHDQYWEDIPGEEILIADPTRNNELVTGMILDAWHHADCRLPLVYNGNPLAQQQTENEIFSTLPFELLLGIVEELEFSDLASLLNASPHVHRAMDGHHYFWLRHLRESMPWFFEMHEFLADRTDGYGITSSKTDELRGKSLRPFFIWANCITTSRRGKRGPFMGVANRRRIWGVCEQLVVPYLAKLRSSPT